MKIIGLSVGLLLALSGLASFAASHRQPTATVLANIAGGH